jgi:hypothetical protein
MEAWKKDTRREPVITDLDTLVPQDYLLRKIEKVMDYEWLYERLSPYYCHDNGRPGTYPKDRRRTCRSTPKNCKDCPCKALCGANEKGQNADHAHLARISGACGTSEKNGAWKANLCDAKRNH